ncbi:hypothetical protein B0H12DRAFT_1133055 [Mycena haematopus]|nr:hypothetical protein B0H12DRAFT_1133055 [Mycena haematopus]
MRGVGCMHTPMSSVSSPGTSKSPRPSRIFSAFRTMRWVTLGRKPQPTNATE